MSHFTHIKTTMVEKGLIISALKDMGYVIKDGNAQIRGFGGKKTDVEIRISTGNFSYDIGFRKSEDAYELVADWWGVKGINKDEFLRNVTQRYAYNAAVSKLQEQGFSLVSEEGKIGNKVHLVLRRMV